MKRRPTGAAAVVIAVGSLLAGCGDKDRGLSDEASALLTPRVEAIRSAAAAGDRVAAQAEAGRVRQTLADLQKAGAVDGAEAETVLEALASVEQQLGLLPEPTTTTTTAAITTTTTTIMTTATATPARPGKDDDEREGRKKGKGGDD